MVKISLRERTHTFFLSEKFPNFARFGLLCPISRQYGSVIPRLHVFLEHTPTVTLGLGFVQMPPELHY